jgi:cell division protein FtsB
MEVKIQVVIDTYKEEIARLTNENVLLKAQIKQLQNELNSDEGSDE